MQKVDLRSVVNLAPQMLTVMEPDGRVTWANEVVLDFLGISLADLDAHDLRARIFHPQDVEKLGEERRAALARGLPFESEQRMRGKDGKYRWFLVRYRPQTTAQGRVVRWYGGATDIEERKQSQEARQAVEEQWRAAFESNPTMYFIVDATATIVSVNALGAEQLGYSASELVGRSVLDIFHDSDRAAVRKHADECFGRPGRMMRWEARKIRKDGTMLWVRETGNAVMLKKRPVLLVVCEDITEQKRAEDAARRSERELRAVIDTIPVMAWTTMPDGSNDFANQHWLEYTGISSKAATGAGWKLSFHAADFASHWEKWRTSLATGMPFENEARIQRARDGEYRWFLHRGIPLRDENGNILKWYGVSTDIDGRKRAEAEIERLHQLERELVQMNRVSMMGELAASLSHEIAQPVSAAVANAEACLLWLQRETPDLREACEAASRIVEDLRRTADIIDRNRSLYRRDAPKREMINLNELVREIIVLLRDKSHQHAISIRTELDTAPATISADRVQLQQVLLNLMLNGVEAMKETGGELTVTSNKTEDGELLISVSDAGIGLPVENAGRIFDPFFTTKAHGTGVGLAISRRIIESHGGRLWATANSGRGATFRFTLSTEAMMNAMTGRATSVVAHY
ncbi:MAG TPA: PAS domain S-box protein [Steroidobacteraceae bacterium]|jgi:PAS domain S-box-containing protein|nr:PAS domain S-box protein [Steroidobacteraceae bacterium]